MQRHGAKAISLELGSMGAPSAKSVPWLFAVYTPKRHGPVSLGVLIWNSSLAIQTANANVTYPKAGPVLLDPCEGFSDYKHVSWRRLQLKRIKSFLGLQVTKKYQDASGRERCAAGLVSM